MANWEVETANSSLEFDTRVGAYNSCCQIDDNHFINFWATFADPGLVQVFTVNTSTWAVTTANSSLQFNASYGQFNSCCKIDDNHFINFFKGTDQKGSVQTFTVNTSTWAVTTANSLLEIDSASHTANSCCQIDSNHFINFWRGNPNAGTIQGNVQTFTVNTSTWAVTTANSILVYDAGKGYYNSCCKIDDNHFINFWQGADDDGLVQVFTVNTSTWAVTTAGSQLEFDTQNSYYNRCFKIDDNHFLNFWAGGASLTGTVQVFTVNTSTWAVTTANSALTFDTATFSSGTYNSCEQIDTNHFINFWGGSGSDGFVQVFEVNTSTWAVTTSAARLEFDTTVAIDISCAKIDTTHYINFWGGPDSDGFVQTFEVTVPAADTDTGFFNFF